MITQKLAVSILALAVAIPVAVSADDQMPEGGPQAPTAAELQALTGLCNSCHGPDGVSGHDDIPSLAGQTADRIVEAIEKFYFYERHCPAIRPRYGQGSADTLNMCEISGRIDKQQAVALGEYYASRKIPDQEQ